MSLLTVRADEVRPGDRWYDHFEEVDVTCTGPAERGRRGILRVPVEIRGRRTSLSYMADEKVIVERLDPPTDEEHEAALRLLVQAEAGQQATSVSLLTLAAVLRLLDSARNDLAWEKNA